MLKATFPTMPVNAKRLFVFIAQIDDGSVVAADVLARICRGSDRDGVVHTACGDLLAVDQERDLSSGSGLGASAANSTRTVTSQAGSRSSDCCREMNTPIID
jgi:hypothetical protein